MAKYVSLSLLFFFIVTSCSVKPEPLNFGKDGCYTCKMTLMDNKFGAEVVTKKGKVYKFDDLNCLMNFLNSKQEPIENIAQYLVIDFQHPEKLIDATKAFYIQSDQIKSPMASQMAAFEKEEDLNTLNTTWQGTARSWEELKTQFR